MTLEDFLKKHIAPALGYNTDVAWGTVNVDDVWYAKQTAFANRAMMSCWVPADWTYMPMHAVDSGLVAVTDGQISLPDVEFSRMLTAWASDPRGATITIPKRHRVGRENNGWTVYDSPGSEVFAFWTTRAPTYDWSSPATDIPDDLVPAMIPAVLYYNSNSLPASVSDRIPTYVQQMNLALDELSARTSKVGPWYVPEYET